MKEIIENSLRKGLEGAHSHINPLDAILDIGASLARKRLMDNSHSIWEILYHLIIWQDIFTQNIKGTEANWDVNSWPTEDEMKLDEDFEQLKERFKKGWKEIEGLIESVDLSEQLSFGNNDPIMQFAIVAITHNSYHIGQIMYLKKILTLKK